MEKEGGGRRVEVNDMQHKVAHHIEEDNQSYWSCVRELLL
jgi:hypothetical protein